MKSNSIVVFSTLLILCCNPKTAEIVSDETNSPQASFKIEILDREALNLIDAETRVQVLASGFEWTEGPLWIEDGSYLLFSDIPNNKVYMLNAQDDTSTYLQASGYSGIEPYGDEPGSNGLLLNGVGELVLMQHGDRRVAKMVAPLDQPAPAFESVVSSYHGKRFNSPNDGVFDREGNLYFTDPPYGLPERATDHRKELNFQGVFCLLQSGDLILVDSLSRPNGIALSNDEKTLFVSVSDANHAAWYQYDLVSAGIVRNRQLFYDATPLVGKEGAQGLPDGMKMHSKDYLFASGPGGIWVFNLAGKPIAKIYTGLLTSNCALDKEEKRLYVTADDYVLAVDLK